MSFIGESPVAVYCKLRDMPIWNRHAHFDRNNVQEELSYEDANFLVKTTRFVNLTRNSFESTLKKLTVRTSSHGSAWRLYKSLEIAKTPLGNVSGSSTAWYVA